MWFQSREAEIAMEQLQTMSGGTGMAEEAKKALENIRKKKAKVDQMHKKKALKGEDDCDQ